MKYKPALDGLRAVAVVLVIAFHTIANEFPGGFIGVDIFFVLSGYLITSNMLVEWDKTNRISIGKFYWRRALRLAPALLLLLSCYVVVAFFIANTNDHLVAAAITAIYAMNWARAFDIGSVGYMPHTWSLAVEQQFYFIWPLLLSALLFLTGRRVTPWCIALLVLFTIGWRLALIWNETSGERIYNGFDTRVDTILVGCCLAFVPASKMKWAPFLVWLALFAAMVFTLFGSYGRWVEIWGFTAIALASAVLVAGAANISDGQMSHALLSSRPLVWLGQISYGMYLWHFPILVGVADRLELQGVTRLAFTLGATIVLATISYLFVEVPFLKKRTLPVAPVPLPAPA
jgi:peptidoglycan/LPS O-acetylase OafA/YrhL